MTTQLAQMLSKMLKIIDDYNAMNTDEKVEVNWQYWITNTVYAEQTREPAYGQPWTVYRAISKDGLVLEVYRNENGMFIRIGSVHKAICDYGG
ncbi:MAG: hypothetical protein QXK11_11515 [Pyrobaculum sp.]|uniref:hypothetical protein n=1 Tax=Pyrobaculum sp. TaxID=2004705 RepID=UPI00317A4205